MDETVISCADARHIITSGRMMSGMQVDIRTLMLYPIAEQCACDIYLDLLKRYDEKQADLEERYGPDSKEAYELMVEKSYVAESSYIPEKCACDILGSLAKDKRHYLRQAVARNPTIPEECRCEILIELASKIGEIAKDMPIKTDSYFGTRQSVAMRRDVPPECREKILAKLVLDPNGYVRKAAKRAYPVKNIKMW